MIKAIETKYKGYFFRSRLEARWAVFLDSFGEEWKYEKEGYELSSGKYLPDFWLPRLDCWLEIKGIEPTIEEIKLCEELANMTDKAVVIAWDLPYAAKKLAPKGWRLSKSFPITEAYGGERLKVYCADCTDSTGGTGWWDNCFWAYDNNALLCICSNNDSPSRCFMSPQWNNFNGMKLLTEISVPICELSVNEAKSAIFEFEDKNKIEEYRNYFTRRQNV